MSVSIESLLYYVLSICIQISHEQCTYVRPDLSSTSYVHPTELCSRTTTIGITTYTGTSTKYVCTTYGIQKHTYSNSNCDGHAEITNLDTSNIQYNCNGSLYDCEITISNDWCSCNPPRSTKTLYVENVCYGTVETGYKRECSVVREYTDNTCNKLLNPTPSPTTAYPTTSPIIGQTNPPTSIVITRVRLGAGTTWNCNYNIAAPTSSPVTSNIPTLTPSNTPTHSNASPDINRSSGESSIVSGDNKTIIIGAVVGLIGLIILIGIIICIVYMNKRSNTKETKTKNTETQNMYQYSQPETKPITHNGSVGSYNINVGDQMVKYPRDKQKYESKKINQQEIKPIVQKYDIGSDNDYNKMIKKNSFSDKQKYNTKQTNQYAYDSIPPPEYDPNAEAIDDTLCMDEGSKGLIVGYDDIKDWFKSDVNLVNDNEKYFRIFIENGYNDFNLIKEITEKQLTQMGIRKLAHVNRILNAIKNMNDAQNIVPSAPKDSICQNWSKDDILKWVNTINLSDAWKEIVINKIQNGQYNGQDIINLQSGKDVAKLFDLQNPMLCSRLWKEIKKIK